MPGWTHRDAFPVVARIIRELSARTSDFATRDEIAASLLHDIEGAALVGGGSGRQGDVWTAGNVVDWFSARFEGSEWAADFDRTIVDHKWAYRPKR